MVKFMKLGIVGSGAIVSYTVNVFQEHGIEVTALWCREVDIESGKASCDKFNIHNMYTNYDEFLADKNIEVVYLGIINSLHYEFAKKALLAGKHVICEKPFTSTEKGAIDLVQTAKEKKLMIFECIPSRYAKNYEAIRENLSKLDDIKLVYCNYSQYSSRYAKYKENIVLPAFDPKLAGGSLYDINVYCIQFVMDMFGEPKDLKYYPNVGNNGIDTSGILVLDYDSFKALCMCAKDSNSPSLAVIQGEAGYIKMDSFMPSFVENITLNLNKQDGVCLDVEPLGDARSNMFKNMKKIIENQNFEQCYRDIDKSVLAMKVMEKARKEAGIYFNDEKEIG